MQRRPMIEATEQSDGMDGAVITDRFRMVRRQKHHKAGGSAQPRYTSKQIA